MRSKRRIWLVRTTAVLLFLIGSFILYVWIVNRNSINMTARQKLLKAVYPITMWLTGNKNSTPMKEVIPSKTSIYKLTANLNNGDQVLLEKYKGKKIMLVNTASDCGFTAQYDGLEKLYQQHRDKLLILAFPANDFKEQEKGTDENIAAFCKLNYGITFPLMKKSEVIKSAHQNEVFRWLTDKTKNGWNDEQPGWNFFKYIVDEQGNLTHVFPATTDPLSSVVVEAVSK